MVHDFELAFGGGANSRERVEHESLGVFAIVLVDARAPWPLIQTSSVCTSSFASVSANTRSSGPSVHMLAP